MEEYSKYIAQRMFCKEKHLLSSYSETVPEILQTFKEGLGEGKLVKNLEIF